MAIELLEYRKLCQITSVLKYKDIPEEYLVEFDGVKYIPYRREERFENGTSVSLAILKSLKANSIIYADLTKLTKCK